MKKTLWVIVSLSVIIAILLYAIISSEIRQSKINKEDKKFYDNQTNYFLEKITQLKNESETCRTNLIYCENTAASFKITTDDNTITGADCETKAHIPSPIRSWICKITSAEKTPEGMQATCDCRYN